MFEKRPLWLALSAITAATAGGIPTHLSAAERAGVASAVTPQAEGRLPGDQARTLFVGSDVFRDEVIRTDASGLAHLLFLDRSALTVSPNAEVTIDRFVYDPATDTGEIGVSAARGVLRFVGGKLSKQGKANIQTPLGNLGIRGGIALVESNGDTGDTIVVLVYGELLTARHRLSGATASIKEHEHGLRLTPDGRIERLGPVDRARLDGFLAALSGPSGGQGLPPLPLPADFGAWLRELAAQNARQDKRDDEQTNAFVERTKAILDSIGAAMSAQQRDTQSAQPSQGPTATPPVIPMPPVVS